MNYKHLFWIIPLTIILTLAVNYFALVLGMSSIVNDYPVVGCILNGENQLNVDTNKLPISKDSQRSYLSKRCAETFIDFNASLEVS